MKPITESQLKFAHQTRALRRLTLYADGGAFELRVHIAGKEELTLVKMRKTEGVDLPRRFNSPLAVLTLLFKFGIHDVNVNLEHWRPEDKSTARTRVDSAARMKEAHEALFEKKGKKVGIGGEGKVPAPQSEATTSDGSEPSIIKKVDSTASNQKLVPPRHEGGITQHGRGIRVEVRKKRAIHPRDVSSDSAAAPTPEQDGQALGVSDEQTS